MLTFLSHHMWLWQLSLSGMAVFTLFTEISFSYLVWNRRLRPVMVTCSVLMHLGIGLIMGLVVFSMLMLAMVIAFVPPDQIRAWVDERAEQLRRRFRRKAAPAPAADPARPAPALVRT